MYRRYDLQKHSTGFIYWSELDGILRGVIPIEKCSEVLED